MSSLRFEDQGTLNQHLESLLLERPLARITSLPALDRLLGGVREGGLTILSGGPGSGKTTLAHQIALDVCGQGVPVIFAELEMGIPQLVAKGVAHMSGGRVAVGEIASAAAIDGELRTAVDSFAEVARLLAYAPDVFDVPSMTRLVDDCVKQTGKVPLLIVDYLQLLDFDATRTFADERLEIKSTVRGLRRLAEDYGAAVIAVSTINRTNYAKNKVGLDALGGCSYIEYSADAVVLLRPVIDRTEGIPSRVVSLTALKNRYGSTGEVRLSFDTDHATFAEV